MKPLIGKEGREFCVRDDYRGLGSEGRDDDGDAEMKKVLDNRGAGEGRKEDGNLRY